MAKTIERRKSIFSWFKGAWEIETTVERLLKDYDALLRGEFEVAKTIEGKIQGIVVTYANKQGVRTIRMYFGPGIQTGWPDVLFLGPGGRVLFIEFKAPGKLPTPKQLEKITILRNLGFQVEVCDNVDKGKQLIAGMFRGKTDARGLIR